MTAAGGSDRIPRDCRLQLICCREPDPASPGNCCPSTIFAAMTLPYVPPPAPPAAPIVSAASDVAPRQSPSPPAAIAPVADGAVEFVRASPPLTNDDLAPVITTRELARSASTDAALLGTPHASDNAIADASYGQAKDSEKDGEKGSEKVSESSKTARIQLRERNGSAPPVLLVVPGTLAQAADGETSPVREPTLTEPAPDPDTSAELTVRILEVTADRQEYDREANVATAVGNVVVRFTNGVMEADRLQINVGDRIAVAEGNVSLQRGEQVLRGERFVYYFVRNSGTIYNANGVVYQPTTGRDLTLSSSLPNDASAPTASESPLQDVIQTGNVGFGLEVRGLGIGGDDDDDDGINLAGGFSGERAGTIGRIRFSADRVDFDADGWQAREVRLTNDPFSPPELELRADTAIFRSIDPERDEVLTTRSRIVFDDGIAIPTFRNRVVLDRRDRDPGLFNIGFDDGDRGGVFIERPFDAIDRPRFNLEISPQYNVQRAFTEVGALNGAAFGVRSRLGWSAGPRTSLIGRAIFNSLDTEDIPEEVRANLRLQQSIGPLTRPHNLNLQASFRDRLFNGSLGLKTVRSSFGAVLSSPVFVFGNTGLRLSYQGGVQRVNADTDRDDLLDDDRENDRITLTRYQAATSLSWSYSLWRGQGLPPTPDAGLRFTSTPIVPYVKFVIGTTGVLTGYSNGDSQNSLSGSVGLQGQFGHFSRLLLDYTGISVRYTNTTLAGESPFEFDRLKDRQRLALGLVQQIVGPIRASVRTSLNLETGEVISTTYSLEYSRRTYNLRVSYNAEKRIGEINFRLNGFNWRGTPGSLDGGDVRSVTEGVVR
ncbi:organic solvent tolerance protein OstA [Rubidibacter lacunae KORDI 51-2]|uniref:Organic solvent tolerance protein OstA n=1 Tax=Rubidibacter lacunae KORDI 51-2 TaxID=582515 RepID=U5DLJ0_9CHRO|nr:DUF3769 domain-containing protein [Rubidibacter lacunae]ERN41444.1 organic solvent tolerance protein OstA [Rubidibacter lacunae KORDI 51-2]